MPPIVWFILWLYRRNCRTGRRRVISGYQKGHRELDLRWKKLKGQSLESDREKVSRVRKI